MNNRPSVSWLVVMLLVFTVVVLGDEINFVDFCLLALGFVGLTLIWSNSSG